MVLRQSRKCEKTLREAVIQKHKSNGNAVEVCLNHASHWGLLRRNTWGNKKLWYVIFLNIYPATDSSITTTFQLIKHYEILVMETSQTHLTLPRTTRDEKCVWNTDRPRTVLVCNSICNYKPLALINTEAILKIA